MPIVKAEKISVKFNSCVDGDTIKIDMDGKIETLRFLAIDTPEVKHPTKGVEPYGNESSEYTCDKVTNAKKIEIEYDSNSDKRDKYDRLLAWVYIDDSLIQKDLLSLGYAKIAYLYGDYKYIDELYDVEEKSKEEKKGLWSEEEYSQKETKKKEKTNTEIIIDKVQKYVTKIVKKIINGLKKELKKIIKSVFS